MDPQLLAIRQRLRDDFPFYAEAALKIRTKNGEISPLVLKPAQQILQDAVEAQFKTHGKVRVIVLKARQQGLSTAIGAWIYWWVTQHTAQRAIVATHHADSTRALFDLTKRYFQNTPAILKPSTRYNSKRELFFDVLDSSFIVGTAGSESIGRGETISQAHLSELAFWPASSARDNFNGLMQAVPDQPGTAVFIESTANGVTGLFYELWRGAIKGENGFVPIFIPWFVDPDYREKAPRKFERTPDEKRLVELYGVNNDQLQWRRTKISQNGPDLFKQEYPATPDEAFLTTGRPVFNTEQLHALLQVVGDKEPLKLLYRMALETDKDGKPSWEKHSRGELMVYRRHSDTEVYTIGADTSAGIKGRDYSVAQVLDRKKRQVATLRGHFAPDYFADILKALGEFYNNALIAPEANNHGILTVNRLFKDLGYPYVYTEVIVDKQTDEETVRIGFHTNVKTKPLIVDKLRAAVRDVEIELNDTTTIREMLTYVVKDNGAMEAEAQYHDDTVMALAIANYVHEGNFEPVENQDNYYVQMI